MSPLCGRLCPRPRPHPACLTATHLASVSTLVSFMSITQWKSRSVCPCEMGFFSFSIISSKCIHLSSFLEVCTAFCMKRVRSPATFGLSPLLEHAAANQRSPGLRSAPSAPLSLPCAYTLSVLAPVMYSSHPLILHLQAEGRGHVPLNLSVPSI